MSYKVEIELLMPDRDACENLLKHLREVKRRDSNGESDELQYELEELPMPIPISNPDGVVTSYSVKMIPDEEDDDKDRKRFDLRTTLDLAIPSIEKLRQENLKIQASLDEFGFYVAAENEPCPFEFNATSEVVFPCEAVDNVESLVEEFKKLQKSRICKKCRNQKPIQEVPCNVA